MVHVKDASRCVGVVDRLIRPEQKARARPREPRRPGARARELRASGTQRKLVPYAEALRAPLRDRLGGTPDRHARVPRHARAPRLPARRARPVHRLVAVLHGLGAEGQVSRDLRGPGRRRGGPQDCSTTPNDCSTQIVARSSCSAHGVYGFFPANSDGDDIVVYTDESRTQRAAAVPRCCGSSGSARGRRRSAAWPTTSPRSASGIADYLGAFAVTAGFGADELAAKFKAGPRRLQRDHGRGAGRPPGRGLRRAAARARPPRLGLRPRREPVEGRPDRREVPRHPPGRRLPVLPRPHREGDALDAARRRGRRPASS